MQGAAIQGEDLRSRLFPWVGVGQAPSGTQNLTTLWPRTIRVSGFYRVCSFDPLLSTREAVAPRDSIAPYLGPLGAPARGGTRKASAPRWNSGAQSVPGWKGVASNAQNRDPSPGFPEGLGISRVGGRGPR